MVPEVPFQGLLIHKGVGLGVGLWERESYSA